MTKLAWFGVILTTIYVGAILYLMNANWDAFRILEPNAWGDFMAGSFGPLAIFWLVLGFFQQGQELRLQVKELALSVEQQKELVGVTRETLDHERKIVEHREKARKNSIRPEFLFTGAGGSSTGQKIKNTLRITNAGASVSGVSFEISPTPVYNGAHPFGFWETGTERTIEMQFLETGHIASGSITINYTDADKNRYRSSFKLTPNPESPVRLEVEHLGEMLT